MNPSLPILCKNKSQLTEIAKKIIETCKNNAVWVFEGEMGAGKTTLIKEICKVLGVKDEVQSPTFSIVNQYESSEKTIYHFDFYRLKSEQEAYDIGYEEYFYARNAYCFLEWASKIPNLLPPNYAKIEIKVLAEEERMIEMSCKN
ncbi:MAG: tRNA (adenosine(37)-N6)-threonylcarbamoyltransferase complex ATPase subunit type 1 TsaE [Raineya sp.]